MSDRNHSAVKHTWRFSSFHPLLANWPAYADGRSIALYIVRVEGKFLTVAIVRVRR